MIVSWADHEITSTVIVRMILRPRYRDSHANGMAACF